MPVSAYARWTRTVVCALLLALIAVAFGSAQPSQAHASPTSKLPPPIRAIQTSDGPIKVYDLNQILPLATLTQPHNKSAQQTRSPSYKLTVVATIVFIIDADTGNLICGYFVGAASASPSSGEVSELGDYYINGAEVGNTDTGDVGSTAEETTCYAGSPHGSIWKAVVNGAAAWDSGIYLHTPVTLTAPQP